MNIEDLFPKLHRDEFKKNMLIDSVDPLNSVIESN